MIAHPLAGFSGSDLKSLALGAAILAAKTMIAKHHEAAVPHHHHHHTPDSSPSPSPSPSLSPRATDGAWGSGNVVLCQADLLNARKHQQPSLAPDAPLQRRLQQWHQQYGEGAVPLSRAQTIGFQFPTL